MLQETKAPELYSQHQPKHQPCSPSPAVPTPSPGSGLAAPALQREFQNVDLYVLPNSYITLIHLNCMQ